MTNILWIIVRLPFMSSLIISHLISSMLRTWTCLIIAWIVRHLGVRFCFYLHVFLLVLPFLLTQFLKLFQQLSNFLTFLLKGIFKCFISLPKFPIMNPEYFNLIYNLNTILTEIQAFPLIFLLILELFFRL